jgi:NAD(P)-dependent dehydrogenase (short-subunit alcohol dehydrogenase family)
MSQKEFSGKVVLVTGAGKGIGRTVAEMFAARGATVAANDISPVNVDMVVAQVNASGGQARAYVHDVAKKVAVQAMVNEISDDFGRIDILVNCANVEPVGPLLDLDEWDLHRIFEVNTIGAFLMMQSVGRVMRAQGGGIIVNVAKMPTESHRAAYAASRMALAGLTRQGALELAAHNIRLHAVTVGMAGLADPGAGYGDPVEAVLALCGAGPTGENGTIINVERREKHG